MHARSIFLSLAPVLLAAWPLSAQRGGEGAPGALVAFVDATVEAGLHRPHWSGVAPPGVSGGSLEMLYMSAGACAADFDRDGWCDLYVTRLDAPNLLYRNLGDGTFEEVAHARGVDLHRWSTECSWADVDDDGDLDLYVLTTRPSERAYLFVNDGTGHFAEEAVLRGLDLTLPGIVAHRLTGAAFADWDRDGDLDAFVCQWHPLNEKTRLLENVGGGRFVDRSAAAGLPEAPHFGFAPRFADVDDDGWPDLLLAADFGTSGLYRNLGDGTFQYMAGEAGVGSDENGMGNAVGDVDGDGRLDWFVTSIFDADDTCASSGCGWGASGNRLYLNRSPRAGVARGAGGGIVFVDGTDGAGVREGFWGWGASFLDFDNDGDLDLGMTNGVVFPHTRLEDTFNADPLRLWANEGGGRMEEVSRRVGFVDDGSGKGFVVFDYDRDGDQDVFVANNQDPPVLFRNEGGNQNAWLRVRLVGTHSSSGAEGARVWVQVEDGGRVQVQELCPGSNYMSQNEPVLHFGLGPGVERVHSLRVRWPRSGREVVLKDVAARREIRLVEGRESAAAAGR